MVAEHDLRDAGLDELLHEEDDRDAVRTPIDQVAYEDKRAIDRAARDIAAEASEQRAEGIDLAVNVSDDIDAIGEEGTYETRAGHRSTYQVAKGWPATMRRPQ
jgi:hypothetical protein